MGKKEEQIKKLMEEYEMLTDEQKRAMCWLVKNRKLIAEFAKEEKMSENEMERLIESARKSRDYLQMAALLYHKHLSLKEPPYVG